MVDLPASREEVCLNSKGPSTFFFLTDMTDENNIKIFLFQGTLNRRRTVIDAQLGKFFKGQSLLVHFDFLSLAKGDRLAFSSVHLFIYLLY